MTEGLVDRYDLPRHKRDPWWTHDGPLRVEILEHGVPRIYIVEDGGRGKWVPIDGLGECPCVVPSSPVRVED